MNHKRKRPKHRRSGCLMCKSHKDERVGKAASEKPKHRRLTDDDIRMFDEALFRSTTIVDEGFLE